MSPSARLGAGCVAGVVVAAAAVAWAQTPERTVRVPQANISLPRGWMLSMTRDHSCQFATPSTWLAQPNDDSASSPDGAMRVNVTAVNSTSWPDHLTTIVGAVHPSAIHERSEHRLWCEFSDRSGVIVQYVSVPGAQTICDAQIETRGASGVAEDVLRRIVDSIGPASWR